MNNFNEIRRPNNFNQPGVILGEKKNEPAKIEMPKIQLKIQNSKLKSKGFLAGLGVLGILILIYLSGIFSGNFVKNKTEWQAVFLNSGEIYFGQVKSQNKNEIIIANIFYLQSKDPLQQGANLIKQSGDITLIKLGSEVHGPTDQMRLNRDHVLYIEDMKDESKIVKAIKDYLKK